MKGFFVNRLNGAPIDADVLTAVVRYNSVLTSVPVTVQRLESEGMYSYEYEVPDGWKAIDNVDLVVTSETDANEPVVTVIKQAIVSDSASVIHQLDNMILGSTKECFLSLLKNEPSVTTNDVQGVLIRGDGTAIVSGQIKVNDSDYVGGVQVSFVQVDNRFMLEIEPVSESLVNQMLIVKVSSNNYPQFDGHELHFGVDENSLSNIDVNIINNGDELTGVIHDDVYEGVSTCM